jgi:hypothetical protein
MLTSGRGSFLKISGLLVLGFIAFLYQPAKGQSTTSSCTDAIANWHRKGTGTNSYRRWIDPKFNQVERSLIEDALRIAVNRLQQKSIWERVQELYDYASVTRDSLTSSGLCNEADVKRNLLFHQLYYLSIPNGAHDDEPAFPDVYIYYGYEPRREGEKGWLGHAPYDTVRIYWDSEAKEWRQKGSFKITLNNHFVAAGGRYSEANDWAGTIAHEMLHNLGHRHPDSNDPNYSKYQINVLDEVVQNDGEGYKGSRPTLLSLHSEDVTVTSEQDANDNEKTAVNVKGMVKITVNGKARVTVNGKPVNE